MGEDGTGSRTARGVAQTPEGAQGGEEGYEEGGAQEVAGKPEGRETKTTRGVNPQNPVVGRCPLCAANNGLLRRSKQYTYSITSSARTSNAGGTVRPRTLAVLRLMTISNLVGCWTGRSAGF